MVINKIHVLCCVPFSNILPPMPVMVLSVYIPIENPQRNYTCRMAREGKIEPVNLLTGQSKGKYLGLYKSKTVVQSFHRKHTPTLTTHMASHYKRPYSWQIQLTNVPCRDGKNQTISKSKFYLLPKRVTPVHMVIQCFEPYRQRSENFCWKDSEST